MALTASSSTYNLIYKPKRLKVYTYALAESCIDAHTCCAGSWEPHQCYKIGQLSRLNTVWKESGNRKVGWISRVRVAPNWVKNNS